MLRYARNELPYSSKRYKTVYGLGVAPVLGGMEVVRATESGCATVTSLSAWWMVSAAAREV